MSVGTMEAQRLAGQCYLENNVTLNPACTDVVYLVVTSFDDTWVLPTSGSSPIKSLVLQRHGVKVKSGITLCKTGEAMSILEWQKARGYANVKEVYLKKLVEHFKCKDLPAELAGRGSTEDRLVVQLVLQSIPDTNIDILRGLLSKRRAFERDWEESTHIEQWLLDEALTVKERAQVCERQTELADNKIKGHITLYEMQQFLDNLQPFLKNKKTKVAKTDVEKAVDKLKRKHGEEWYTFLDPGNAIAEMNLLKPPSASVVQDWPSHKRHDCHSNCFDIQWGRPKINAFGLEGLSA